jgi:hypothetical protein
MKNDGGRFAGSLGSFRVIAAAGALIVLAAFLMVGLASSVQALPSFARQTGQPCGTCHTDFPYLTPFGRRFKLLGYTVGGGLFRTTPFPTLPDDARAQAAANMRMYLKAVAPAVGASDEYVPPVAMMTIVGLTHTQAPLTPPTDPYKPNDNVVVSPFSGFWGGAITDNIGAFAQVTYNAPPAGGFADPFGHTWTWDNTDIRYARELTIGGMGVIFGITANNNPSVQDVWNTTPAWAFPQVASTIGNSGPSAKTIIEGAFSAHVGGVGAYAYVNDVLYLEATAYRTLDFRAQNTLGADPFGSPGLLDGFAPYWRAALEPHWGNHYLMVGTFGMMTNIHNWIDPTFAIGSTGTFSQTDKFTDIGFDTQYQYQGDNYWITLRGSYIREFQQLDSTFGMGGSSNPADLLNSFRLVASLAYGADNRIVLTGQYFNTWGTADPILYTNLVPDSDGWIAEIAYIPFSASKAPGWPWANARIGVNYTFYNKFNGTSIAASDNNTLFLHLWLAM